MPLNDSNFLVWFAPGESPTKPPLPRTFVHEPDVLSPVVWVVPFEDIIFYVNTTSNVALTGPLDLQHEAFPGVSVTVDYALSVIDFPGGQHSHGQISIPPGLPEGFVRFRIGSIVTQWLWLTSMAKAEKVSAQIRFNNNGHRLQNIRYGYLPAGFMQQFRIRLAVESEESAHNKEIYTESDTGKRRHLYSEPTMIVKFITPEYDRWGHRAMASLIEHDTILINNQPYTYQGPYRANMTLGDALSTGDVELCEENYSTLHRN